MPGSLRPSPREPPPGRTMDQLGAVVKDPAAWTGQTSPTRRGPSTAASWAERHTRGAPPGDALAEAARRTGIEADVLDLVLARSAWKSTVAVRPCAGNARLEWPKTLLPALEHLSELRRAATFGSSTARVSFSTTRHPPRLSTLTATGAPPYRGSAVTMHPPGHRAGAGGGLRQAPRAVVPAAAHAGGLLAGAAAGRHMGGGTPGGARHPAHAP